jgi:putative endonuclease
MSGAWVYILKCVDGSYYTGLTRHELPESRMDQHNQGTDPAAYTFSRRPVKLVHSEHFDWVTEAIAAERQIKGWSRAKKEAFIQGNWKSLQKLSKRRGGEQNK